MKPRFKVEEFVNGKLKSWQYSSYKQLIEALEETKDLAPESINGLHVTEFFYSYLYNGQVMHATSLMANQVLDRVISGDKK